MCAAVSRKTDSQKGWSEQVPTLQTKLSVFKKNVEREGKGKDFDKVIHEVINHIEVLNIQIQSFLETGVIGTYFHNDEKGSIPLEEQLTYDLFDPPFRTFWSRLSPRSLESEKQEINKLIRSINRQFSASVKGQNMKSTDKKLEK